MSSKKKNMELPWLSCSLSLFQKLLCPFRYVPQRKLFLLLLISFVSVYWGPDGVYREEMSSGCKLYVSVALKVSTTLSSAYLGSGYFKMPAEFSDKCLSKSTHGEQCPGLLSTAERCLSIDFRFNWLCCYLSSLISSRNLIN